MSDYTITNKDVASVVKYLHIFHPDKANEAYAVALLEYLQASYHRMAVSDPDALEDLLKAFEASKSKDS